MGELAVAQGDGVLRTLLGSCIGIALYDRRQAVGGLAHVVLPQSRKPDDPPGKFVDTAIPALLQAMSDVGTRPIKAEARIAGGANMFATTVTDTVGRRNIEACERLLAEHRIPLVARHCGGEQGRRMKLETSTGRVTIEIVGMDPIEL
jgi:chemotaxis protein CheD